jgi:hypothetical protein
MSAKEIYNCTLDVIKAFYHVAFVIRFSVAMSLLAGIAIRFADQSLEALRVLAADDSAQFWPRVLLVVSALILSLLSWYCARVLLYLIEPLPGAKDCTARAKEFWICYLPRFIGALPLLFIAWALWTAADSTALEARNHATRLKVLAIISLLMAFILYFFFHFRRWLMARFKSRVASVKNRKGSEEGKDEKETAGCSQKVAKGAILPGVGQLAKSGKVVLLLTILLWLGLLLLFTFQSGRQGAVKATLAFGPMATVLLFAALWIPIGSALVYAGKLTRLPLFIILLILAVSFSAADWNDNHLIRYKKDEALAKPMDYNEGFKQWLSGRCDRDAYDTYPVFIVSAEGGGLRAAYFASLVLAKLQDANPAFAHHVFAISGVSGGSLGGAVFAGLAAKYVDHDGAQPCNPQVKLPSDKAQSGMRGMTDEVLGQDLLSPLLASMLYPDLLQRFLPLPIQRFDRARALEDAMGYYWYSATGGSEFYNNFYLYDLYQDAASRQSTFATRSTPALFLNVTRVETGEQMVVSNLNPAGPDTERNNLLNGLTSLADADPTMSLPLCTAACLSARFPLVTPAGYLPAKVPDGQGNIKDGKFRYVDGGYFENSGTATVLDLLSAMDVNAATDAARKNIQIIVIRIGTNPGVFQFQEGGKVYMSPVLYSRQGLGEIKSPIATLLNTRNARGNLSVREMETALRKFNDRNQAGNEKKTEAQEPALTQTIATPAAAAPGFKLVSAKPIHFQVNEGRISLPLGWLLSAEARQCMKEQLDKVDGCFQDTSLNYNGVNEVLNILKRKQ